MFVNQTFSPSYLDSLILSKDSHEQFLSNCFPSLLSSLHSNIFLLQDRAQTQYSLNLRQLSHDKLPNPWIE